MTRSTQGGAPAQAARLRAAFADEELRGFQLAARVRLLMVAFVGVWLTIENSYPEFLYFYPYLLLFSLLGYGPLWVRRAGARGAWVTFLFPLLDMVFLAVAVVLPNPLENEPFPPQMLLRFGNEMYLFLFIAASVFTYSPAAVMWSGVAAAAVWSVVTLGMLRLPESFTVLTSAEWAALPPERQLQMWLDPHRINLGLWGRQVVLFLVTAGALSAFVRRARRLVARQTEVERERANLSRYFSPNLVEELARSDAPLGPTRQQDVAVLFADLVGFTRLAESLPPAAVIELLRGFHGRMERAVFDHGGTLDKYIGDAVMATFGTPRSAPGDAANALRCAGAMVAAMAAWNAERAGRGEAPVRIGIGAHYGPVVLGDIGGESRLEFAVLGDTVNVAQRLERLTREIGAAVVVSDALIAAARREGPPAALLEPYRAGPPQTLRGRDRPLAVWTR